MTDPIQSDGEAMPAMQGAKTERPAALLILDAKDVLSGIKELNTAIYLAVHGLGERSHMNALAAITDIIGDKIEEAEEILDAAMAERGVH